MLSTLSSEALDVLKGAVIYMTDINNNQLPLHSFSMVGAGLQIALRYNIYQI